ncbi:MULTISPECIES: hypothetical protein [unclassified Kitasatospora]|uniref:hypothetical protein n=1 Tax=unclassified Kitasatospora TaxID=2633591 RepID=UPI002E2EB538|nr:hypothetical protein [Kitasatospora sp. NBC_01246]
MERRREAALTGGTAGRRLTSIDGGRGADTPAGPAGPPPQEPGALRGVRPDRRDEGEPPTVPEQARLWHVVLSVAGQTTPLSALRAGLERLAHDHSFFLTARYAADHAEIRYWEQARDLHDAAAIALRLWGEHKVTANLPPWEIVGLEVVDRATYHKRVAEGFGGPPPHPGGVHPY